MHTVQHIFPFFEIALVQICCGVRIPLIIFYFLNFCAYALLLFLSYTPRSPERAAEAVQKAVKNPLTPPHIKQRLRSSTRASNSSPSGNSSNRPGGLLQRLAVSEAQALYIARQSTAPGRKHLEALARALSMPSSSSPAASSSVPPSLPSAKVKSASTRANGKSKTTNEASSAPQEDEEEALAHDSQFPPQSASRYMQHLGNFSVKTCETFGISLPRSLPFVLPLSRPLL